MRPCRFTPPIIAPPIIAPYIIAPYIILPAFVFNTTLGSRRICLFCNTATYMTTNRNVPVNTQRPVVHKGIEEPYTPTTDQSQETYLLYSL